MFKEIYKEIKEKYEKDFEVGKNSREKIVVIVGGIIAFLIIFPSGLKSGEFSLNSFWVVFLCVFGFFYVLYNMASYVEVRGIFKKILKQEGFKRKTIELSEEMFNAEILERIGLDIKVNPITKILAEEKFKKSGTTFENVVYFKNIGGNDLIIEEIFNGYLGKIEFNSETFFKDFFMKKDKLFYLRSFFSNFFLYFLAFIILSFKYNILAESFFNKWGIVISIFIFGVIFWFIIPIIYRFIKNSEFYKNNYSKKYNYVPSFYEEQNLPLGYVRILENIFEIEKSFGRRISFKISENKLYLGIKTNYRIFIWHLIAGIWHCKDNSYREYTSFIMLMRYLEKLNSELKSFYYIKK